MVIRSRLARWKCSTVGRHREEWTCIAGKDWTESHQAGIDLRRWWVEEHFPEEFGREERAAIMEYDGGLIREAAERAASLWPSGGGDA